MKKRKIENEDFGEKIENLEKMNLLKNLKKYVDKWKKIKKKKKNQRWKIPRVN